MAIEGRLEVVEGSDKGLSIALGDKAVTIGRAPGNTVVVKDAAVSRQHARFFERDGRHFVADLNSSHGTFVNGTKVTLQELHPGDQVKLGATLFRFGDAPSPAVPPVNVEPRIDPVPERSLPPVNATYRRALDESGEDPFALEEPLPSTAPAVPVAPRPPGGANAPPRQQSGEIAPPQPQGGAPSPPAFTPPKSFEAAPQIEFRGRTAEQFAARATASPLPAASGAAAVHVPPPLSGGARRRRGPFSFLRDELDQRGRFARALATLFALAVAGGLLWISLHLTEGTAKSQPPTDENPQTGPERPSLPPHR